MVEQIEISTLDLRYKSYRMPSRATERKLLDSIAARGIETPLEGASDNEGRRVLLNGFKRLRCARKLNIHTVPYVSLGEEEAAGITALLRISNAKSLGILEQAGFVDELKKVHGLSTAEIAERVERSKGWVSMRLGLISEMTGKVREKLFAGAFPVYSYMYTLRPFMRMNGGNRDEIEEFILSVSGKGLSVRDIERLAKGFFQGPDSFREQVREGSLGALLDWIRTEPENPEGCSDWERAMLRDLEIVQKYMRRVTTKCLEERETGRPFCSEAHLLAGGILSKTGSFCKTLRQFHDRCGKA